MRTPSAPAPHEETIELFVELVPPPEGQLTPKLWELGPADKMTIRPRAKGIFTFKPALSKHMLVSTVTGVVPYISYLRDYLHNGLSGHQFYVLQGASYDDEFTYKDELEALANDHPDRITYVPTVSRPDEERNGDWTGERGRVNSIVERYADEWGLTPEDALVYACGPPRHDRGRQRAHDPKGLQGRRGALLERGLTGAVPGLL